MLQDGAATHTGHRPRQPESVRTGAAADPVLEVGDRRTTVGTDTAMRRDARVTLGPQLVLDDRIGDLPGAQQQPIGLEHDLLLARREVHHAVDGIGARLDLREIDAWQPRCVLDDVHACPRTSGAAARSAET